jgi:hypothetical protein
LKQSRKRTGVEEEGRTFQVERERYPVCTDGDTFSDTVEIIDFISVVVEFIGGSEKLSDVDTSVGAAIVNTRISQSL